MAKQKAVVEFTASWIPGEGEKDDPNLGFSGMIQVVDGKPTNHPAHVIWRDIEGTKPSWWPGITIPAKKQISYGPTFQDEYPYKTDLHATKIVKGSVFSVTAKDGAVTRYRIEKVETLAG